MLIFETCNQKQSDIVCQSEDKIKEWMVFKYIAVLSNQRKFIYFSKLLLGNSIFLRYIRNCSAFNFVVRFCALFQNADELW